MTMMKRLTLVFAMCAVMSSLGESAQQVDVNTLGPQAGQKAPAVSLPGHDGKTHTLASAAGPKGTMLVFFRSADW
jgi:hypothetical protein